MPSAPSALTMVERLRDYMVLSWQAPAKSGGAEIRGYYLDYRTVKGSVTSKWHEINTKAVTGTNYKVKCTSGDFIHSFLIFTANLPESQESWSQLQ